jgi:hypothetical protein
MPGPHDHIAGLRLRDPAESFHARVEIIRARIEVRESGAAVYVMNQVRTVVGGIAPHPGVECDCNNGESIIAGQCLSSVVLGRVLWGSAVVLRRVR